MIYLQSNRWRKKLDPSMEDEGAFWKDVAQDIARIIPKLDDADAISLIEETDHTAKTIAYMETLNKQNRTLIRPVYSKVNLNRVRYEKKMLRLVDGTTNTRLFYDLVPNNMGHVTCEVGARFGMIGSKTGTNYLMDGRVLKSPMPSWMYWVKYFQLISEGYSDMTSDLSGDDEDEILQMVFGAPKGVTTSIPQNSPAIELYEKLSEDAKESLSTSFSIDFMGSKPPFNRTQVNSSWKQYTLLQQAKTAEEANQIIEKMIAIMQIPFKKGQTVASFLVPTGMSHDKTMSAIAEKLDDAEARIHAMELLAPKEKAKDGIKEISLFGDVSIEDATPEETAHVVNDLVAPNYRKQIIKVYRCTPKAQKERFDAYCADNNVKNVAELFHGSRTENFVSIIKNGLTVHVGAANGRMFGNGTYFSHDFIKSLGYTSINHSKWSHGSASRGYMAVMDVAYGEPCDPGDCQDYSQSWLRQNGYHCVHARRGFSGLQMDEIIVYDDAASCIKYLIEFGE